MVCLPTMRTSVNNNEKKLWIVLHPWGSTKNQNVRDVRYKPFLMKVKKSMLDVYIKRLHHTLFSLHAIHFVFVFEHLLASGLL